MFLNSKSKTNQMEYISEKNFSSLDDRLLRFFGFCQDVFNQFKVKNEVSKLLNQFNQITLKRHKKAFMEIFNEDDESILLGFTSTDWIQNDVALEYVYSGEVKYSINLSAVYRYCCKWSNNNEKQFKKYSSLPEERRYELMYSKIFLYLLYCCFELFCSPGDRKQLRNNIDELLKNIKAEKSNDNNPLNMGEAGKMISSIVNVAKEDKRLGKFFSQNNIQLDSLVNNITRSLSSGDGDMVSMFKNVLSSVNIDELDDEDDQEENIKSQKKSSSSSNGKEEKEEETYDQEIKSKYESSSVEEPEVFDL
jgi:hypothetical protein